MKFRKRKICQNPSNSKVIFVGMFDVASKSCNCHCNCNCESLCIHNLFEMSGIFIKGHRPSAYLRLKEEQKYSLSSDFFWMTFHNVLAPIDNS